MASVVISGGQSRNNSEVSGVEWDATSLTAQLQMKISNEAAASLPVLHRHVGSHAGLRHLASCGFSPARCGIKLWPTAFLRNVMCHVSDQTDTAAIYMLGNNSVSNPPDGV